MSGAFFRRAYVQGAYDLESILKAQIFPISKSSLIQNFGLDLSLNPAGCIEIPTS